MGDLRRAAISKDWLHMETTVTAVDGETEVVLDDQKIEFAFILDGQGSPGDDDWIEAEWIGDAATRRVARLLIGPDTDFVPTATGYAIWRRLTDNPEIPAEVVDWIRFY